MDDGWKIASLFGWQQEQAVDKATRSFQSFESSLPANNIHRIL
jgi:hypothetical protein